MINEARERRLRPSYHRETAPGPILHQTRTTLGPVRTGTENLAPTPHGFEYRTVIPTQKFTGLYILQYMKLYLLKPKTYIMYHQL